MIIGIAGCKDTNLLWYKQEKARKYSNTIGDGIAKNARPITTRAGFVDNTTETNYSDFVTVKWYGSFTLEVP